jgi:hypothetical protein
LSYSFYQPVRLAYQPPVSSTFLSEQTNQQQPASSTILSEQTSTSHQPPANRTGCISFVWMTRKLKHKVIKGRTKSNKKNATKKMQ